MSYFDPLFDVKPLTHSEQAFINRVLTYTKSPIVSVYNPIFKKFPSPPGLFAYLDFDIIGSDKEQVNEVHRLFQFMINHKQDFRSLKVQLHQERKFILEKIGATDD